MDREFERRLTIIEQENKNLQQENKNLQQANKQVTSAINELIVETRLVAQATVGMQKTLSQLGDVYDKFILLEHKFNSDIKDLDFKYSRQVQNLSEEISKNNDLREGFNRIKWAIILGIIGLGVTAVSGGSIG